MSYLYSLPTTAALKLTAIISDPTNSHVSDIARATNARNRVRAVLKETRRADGQSKDWMACANVSCSYVWFVVFAASVLNLIHWLTGFHTLSLLQALQDYLPHLIAIMQCTENDALLLKSVPGAP